MLSQSVKQIPVIIESDYSKFVEGPINRDIDMGISKTKSLIRSMKQYGWLPFFPAWVKRRADGMLVIQTGHHRFNVARHLGIPVCYVVYECDFDIYKEMETTEGWKLEHYLQSQIRNGNPTALVIDSYRKKTGIPIKEIVSIIGGSNGEDGNKIRKFKRGDMRIVPSGETKLNNVIEIIEQIKIQHPVISRSRCFIVAACRVLDVPEIDVKRLSQKLKAHSDIIKKCADADCYIDILEEVYNRMVPGSQRIPLAWKAKQISTEKQKKFCKQSSFAAA